MEINTETLWAYIAQISIVLASVGALNWGLVGWFDFNLVEVVVQAIRLGETTELLVYTLVGLGGLLGLADLYRKLEL